MREATQEDRRMVDSGKYIYSGMVWGSVHHSHNAVGVSVGVGPMVATRAAHAQLQRRV